MLDGIIPHSQIQTIPNTPTSIKYITRESDVGPAVSRILRFPFFGWDTETYQTNRNYAAFHPWEGAKIRVSSFGLPTGETFVFDLKKVKPDFHKWIFPNISMVVGQNLKFDIQFLQYWYDIWDYGPIFDTMIAGQLISEGRVTAPDLVPVGLDHLAKRILGVDLPKEGQHYDWSKDELDMWAIEYAARDSLIVLPIYQYQLEKLKEQSQLRVAQVDFDMSPVAAALELNGIKMDAEKWEQQYQKVVSEVEPMREELWNMLGQQKTLFGGVQTLNLNAPAQVMAAFEAKGLPIAFDKKSGKPTVSGPRMRIYAEQHKEISVYIKYKKMMKLLQSYGPNWTEKISHFDGRIHGHWKIIGAETGRMAANGPNLTQIPKQNEYRNCFVAEPGHIFIDTDYSLCELRILCELCRDPRLFKAFEEGHDLHRYTASLIWKIPIDSVTPKQRAIAKNINFGIVYGIGAAKFAEDADLTLEEAERIMKFYLEEAYPKMGQWLYNQAQSTIRRMLAVTMLGRRRKYYGDIEDTAIRSAIERNGKNLPVQGGNADITKYAARKIYNRLQGRKDIKQVLVIHDESVLESEPKSADEAQWIQETSMLEAEQSFLHTVKCKVDTDRTIIFTKDPTEEQKAQAERLVTLSRWI